MKPSVRVFAILVAVCALTVPQQAQQSPTTPTASTIATLLQRARTGGSVRVIVGVRTPFVPEATLSAGQALDQRAAIAQAQAAILTRLAGFGAVPRRRFETIPFFSVDVAPQRWNSCARCPGREHSRNVAEPPLLAESAARLGRRCWQDGQPGGWAVAILDTGIDITHLFTGRIISKPATRMPAAAAVRPRLLGGAVSSTAQDPAITARPRLAAASTARTAAARRWPSALRWTGDERYRQHASIISVQVFTGFDASTGGTARPQLRVGSDRRTRTRLQPAEHASHRCVNMVRRWLWQQSVGLRQRTSRPQGDHRSASIRRHRDDCGVG